jgi:hypothetical protein
MLYCRIQEFLMFYRKKENAPKTKKVTTEHCHLNFTKATPKQSLQYTGHRRELSAHRWEARFAKMNPVDQGHGLGGSAPA